MKVFKSVVVFFIALTFINQAHSELGILHSTKLIMPSTSRNEDNQAPKFDPQSRFASLAQMYSLGELVSIEEIQGWYSGRCFSLDVPNLATNVLLAKTTVKNGDDEGPAFPTPDSNFITLGVRFNSEYKALPAEFFDNYDSNADVENFSSLINQAIESGKYSELNNSDEFSPLEWTLDIEKNGRLDISNKVKKNGEYLVVEMTNLIKNNSIYSDSSGKVVKYNIGPIVYCYFFKQIKN